MYVEISVADVTARLNLWTARAPQSVANLLAALPAEPIQLVPTVWSGTAMEAVLPAGDDWFVPSEVLGCSLYPGMVAVRQTPGELMISFGTAESRSAVGREYCVVVGRIDTELAALREVLATSTQVGVLSATLRVVTDGSE